MWWRYAAFHVPTKVTVDGKVGVQCKPREEKMVQVGGIFTERNASAASDLTH